MATGRIWQNGFWNHIIRDNEDMQRHYNYIHYNPVKHGLVRRAFDYPHTSIHLIREYYPEDWGASETDEPKGEFPE